MRPRRPISSDQKESLYKLLKSVKKKADYQRVLCVWLRALNDLSADEIATLLGLSIHYVKKVQGEYFSGGEKELTVQNKGGRRRQNLTVEEEREFLAPFLREAERGGVLVVGAVHRAYEARVGHPVPLSTVTRLLARHDWRKVIPRPQHPKSDPAAQEAFKKTSRPSSTMK